LPVSTLLAAAVGIPLGIWLTRRPKLARPILVSRASCNDPEPRPLPASLLPLPLIGGIGAHRDRGPPRYAMSRFLRNTTPGILSVDPAIVEAATGLWDDAAPAASGG